jgi:hypothetical protein
LVVSYNVVTQINQGQHKRKPDYNTPGRDVDKFFKTLEKLESTPVFSLAKSESNWPKI